MVHGLSIPLAHVSLINHNDIPLAKIVHDKDFFQGRRPSEKSHSQRGLGLPNTLPRKMNTIITCKDPIIINHPLV
jgi:hypothetical protein